MQTYKVKVKEISYAEYKVQANSEAEAIEKYTESGEEIWHEFSGADEESIKVELLEKEGK